MAPRRKPTSTSSFGVGRRESHDASGFYARFKPPVLSADEAVQPPCIVDELLLGDSRRMDKIDAASVALVVTSPPYFAGKEYEREMGQGGVPASYFGYLEMLHDVFAECADKLEPGGRLAVNVANLGRKPYRSLSADVIGILQDRLGLLLRGEVIWCKAKGLAGSCAWGSFQSPANPTLRDRTERVVIASKGRFDRAVPRPRRRAAGLPAEASITREEFMEATTDVWEIASERATRVGHPAPFPVELPQRLIELYTYRDDLVLDPFVGSGSTPVAAVRTGRRFMGYDTDAGYLETSRRRVAEERARLAAAPAPTADGALARAVAEGRAVVDLARIVLELSGFAGVAKGRPVGRAGVAPTLAATDRAGRPWHFEVSGALTTTPAGLRRADALWTALGRAAVLHSARPEVPVVLLTTEAPAAGSPGDAALAALRPAVVLDVVELLNSAGRERLRRGAEGVTPTGT